MIHFKFKEGRADEGKAIQLLSLIEIKRELKKKMRRGKNCMSKSVI